MSIGFGGNQNRWIVTGKLINDMDDWEVRKMAYKWVLVLRSKPCPEKKIEKIEDIIAMTAKEIAESKFGY